MEINYVGWNVYASYADQGASVFCSPIQWSGRIVEADQENVCFLINLDL